MTSSSEAKKKIAENMSVPDTSDDQSAFLKERMKLQKTRIENLDDSHSFFTGTLKNATGRFSTYAVLSNTKLKRSDLTDCQFETTHLKASLKRLQERLSRVVSSGGAFSAREIGLVKEDELTAFQKGIAEVFGVSKTIKSETHRLTLTMEVDLLTMMKSPGIAELFKDLMTSGSKTTKKNGRFDPCQLLF